MNRGIAVVVSMTILLGCQPERPVAPDTGAEGAPPAPAPATPAPANPPPPRPEEPAPIPPVVPQRPQLTGSQRAELDAAGWRARVGAGRGVWVSVAEQRLRVIEGDEIVWEAVCSTAANGTGSEMDSLKTPLGWHCVAEKAGAGARWGQVFRSKQPTSEVWRRGVVTTEDLVLTRILALDGLEPGKNKGGNVDSFTRAIYIHGTNAEHALGTPASHGCVRLSNDDVVRAFDLVSLGARVLITESRPASRQR